MALAVLSVAVLVSRIPNELLWVTIGLPLVLYAAFGAALIGWAEAHGADLVCLAGFLQLLAVPDRWQNRVVNIHPSLLPAFPGVDAQGQSRISMEDYAIALADELETPRHERSQMTAGY